ncbi:MAG: metal ABC transporter ATP-binding protein [Leptolyngbya sp. PLA1]|nr:metal ABC transporter ATP-binding protein [Leptolyngbya sp. PLA1]
MSYAYPVSGVDATRAKEALRDVSLRVGVGERLGVLGPNGGGKSTLLKLTLGLLSVQQGTVRVFGMGPSDAARAGLIGYVPQRATCELAFPISCRQVVRMGATLRAKWWEGTSAAHREAAERALSLVGALDWAEAPIGRVSGGQFQRVMIARALAGGPRLLLLDEPTIGIDVAGQRQFADLLGRLHAQLGLTVIVVSHDIRTVAAGCDHVACLSRTLHSHSTPEGLTPRVLAEVFRHDVAAVFGDVHVDAHAASTCRDPSHAHGPARSRPRDGEAGEGGAL